MHINSYENIYNAKNPSLTINYCGWEKCLSSYSFGPATRPHYLLHYILSGEGTYYVNGNSYKLTKDEGFLIFPGESTYYKADDNNPWEYCWISFHGHEALNILNKCGLSNENLILKDIPNDLFKNKLLSLIHNYEVNSKNELSLIGEFYLAFSTLYKKDISKEKNLTQNYIDKAIDYIYNNYSYDINITNISNYVGIDRTYLYKLFIERFNTSPQKYLINFRLNTSLNLLQTTDMNITEIALSCGFKDIQSFCRHFKKHFNFSPSKYRKCQIFLNI